MGKLALRGWGRYSAMQVAVFVALLGPAWSATYFVATPQVTVGDEGDGTLARPFKTISYAMSKLMPGDTLNLAAGTYRDALILPKRAWSRDRPTVIVGTGEVNLLGSERVGGWEARGNGIYVKRPWILEPQQVIVNGLMLKQIGGTIFNGFPTRPGHELTPLHVSQGGIWPTRILGERQSLPVESFLYDSVAKELIIHTSAPFAAVEQTEIAMRPFLVRGDNVAGITIRNLRIRYANTTTTSRQGAVTLIGQGNTLDGLVVAETDGVGIEVAGDDNTVRNCQVIRAGYLGIKARGWRLVLENNEVSYNNTRQFNKWWEAGGIKVLGGAQAAVVAGNRVHHNFADGVWFDWGNENNLIDHNIVAYNAGFGIHYEASSRATIQDNSTFGNSQRGIYLSNSRDSVVMHNLVVANGLEGIAVVDEHRTDPQGLLDLRPRGNTVFANLVAWNKGLALILPGREYANLSDGNLFVTDRKEQLFSMGWPRTPFSRKSLETWRNEESQDLASAALIVSMLSSLRSELNAGQLEPNWSSLLAIRPRAPMPNNELQARLPRQVLVWGLAGPRH